MENIRIQFWNHLRQLRKDSWLSQEGLALKSWLHRTYIWIVERGEKNLSLENMQRIAKALNIEIKELFNFNKD